MTGAPGAIFREPTSSANISSFTGPSAAGSVGLRDRVLLPGTGLRDLFLGPLVPRAVSVTSVNDNTRVEQNHGISSFNSSQDAVKLMGLASSASRISSLLISRLG